MSNEEINKKIMSKVLDLVTARAIHTIFNNPSELSNIHKIFKHDDELIKQLAEEIKHIPKSHTLESPKIVSIIENIDNEIQKLSFELKFTPELLKKLEQELLNQENYTTPEQNNENTNESQPAKPIKEKFIAIRQGQATNQLTKINARKRDNLKVSIIKKSISVVVNDFTVEIKNFPESGELKNSTLQLLDALTITFTSGNAKSLYIYLPLHEYMNMREIKDRKTAKKQVEEDLEILYNLTLHYKEKRRGKDTGNFIDVRLIDKKGVIKNGIIGLRITTDFYELLQTYNIMPYPIRLLTLNNQANPNSFYFGRKIAEHKNMNYFKPNADIISVETLLEASPLMPSFDEVINTDRHYKSRIIEPFENDMKALEDTEIFTWEYCHKKGEPLTNEELDILYGKNKKYPSYELFRTLLIKITWRDYPTRTKPPKKHKIKQTETPPAIAL